MGHHPGIAAFTNPRRRARSGRRWPARPARRRGANPVRGRAVPGPSATRRRVGRATPATRGRGAHRAAGRAPADRCPRSAALCGSVWSPPDTPASAMCTRPVGKSRSAVGAPCIPSPQFHHRNRETRCLRAFREQRGHVVEVAAARRAVGTAMHGTCDNPADVGVDHRHLLPIGEAGHSSGGVCADARQGQQDLDVRRHLVTVLGRDHRRAFVQTFGPARVPELAPGAQHVGGTSGGGGRRRRPPCDPAQPGRFDAGHRRLLQHELADQDLPGRHTRPAPRQVPLLTVIPSQKPGRVDHLSTTQAEYAACRIPAR